jgi:hypothetical protein
MRRIPVALCVIALAAESAAAADWQTIITPEDHDRLDRLAEAIEEGDARAAASSPAPEDYGWFKCRITAGPDGLLLEKISGSQRLTGYLYPDGPSRLILLGAATVNDQRPLPYSVLANEADLADLDADLVGVLTQPAPDRLRILFPWPHYESIYDVMELTR